MKGLRKYLSPFAPDQSGAAAVLCEFHGLIIILDAGAVRETYADLMSQDGLRVVVRFSAQDFVIWMRFLDGMTAW